MGVCCAALALAVACVCFAAGCGDSSGGAPTQSAERDLGRVAFDFTLPGGQQVSAITYAMSNGVNSYSGTMSGDTPVGTSFVIPAVAAGSGYGISLAAESDDGSISCSGSVGLAPDGGPAAGGFAVVTQSTAMITLVLTCVASPQDAGNPG
jgi:hypothetical protein